MTNDWFIRKLVYGGRLHRLQIAYVYVLLSIFFTLLFFIIAELFYAFIREYIGGLKGGMDGLNEYLQKINRRAVLEI